MTEEQLRTAWQEHCAPLLRSGAVMEYGSPQRIAWLRQREQLKRLAADDHFPAA
jgi:hypothetical protein